MRWLSQLLFGRPRSSRWKALRKRFIRQNPRCEACGAGNDLEAHHIFPYHLFPELELEEGNLITLCGTCHFVFGHLKDWGSYDPHVRMTAKWYRGRVDERP